MRYVIAFAVFTCSVAAVATPVEIDAATKAKQNEKYFAARGWKVLPLPPLTSKDSKTYENYVRQLHDQCPAVYEHGYVQGGLVKLLNAIYKRDQGAVLDDAQEKAVLATGADRAHFIAHCEHLAAGTLEQCQQYVVHRWLDYKSVAQCLNDRLGKTAAGSYLFMHCVTHAGVDPATGGTKLEALACATGLMAVMKER